MINCNLDIIALVVNTILKSHFFRQDILGGGSFKEQFLYVNYLIMEDISINLYRRIILKKPRMKSFVVCQAFYNGKKSYLLFHSIQLTDNFRIKLAW